jgi:hypothetical protein
MLLIVAGPGHGAAVAAPVEAPLGRPASEIVLTPTDLGPDFAVASSGETVQGGQSAFVQTLVRTDGSMPYLEPDGIFGVRSAAMVLTGGQAADATFDQLASYIFADFAELPVGPLADRARGGISRADGPYGAASKLIVFRAGSTIGWVSVMRYDEVTTLDDVIPLARIMAARASG